MSSITKKCGEELKAYPTVKYTWRIENVSINPDWVFFSDPFFFEGYNWNLFLDTTEDPDHCFVCLELQEEETTPLGVEALVTLTMIDQLDHNGSKTKHCSPSTPVMTIVDQKSEHPFLSSELLHDEQKGYLLNEACIIEVELMILNTSPPLLVNPICDYVLHSETMDSIHTKAKSFLKSSSSSSTDDDKNVKLLEDAVESKERKLEKLGMLRKRHAQELGAATKEWKDFVDQTFSEVMDGTTPSLCTDFDKFVNTQEGAIENAGKKVKELRRRGEKEKGAARREAQVLMVESVEASRRTHQLFHKITNQLVSSTSNKSEEEEWVHFT